MAPIVSPIVLEDMKSTHALNFFLVGLGMCFSPALWPAYFPGSVMGGNTSELWLLSMGAAQMTMGAWVMGLNEVPRLMYAVTHWEPVSFDFALPDVSWVLPESFYAGLSETDDASIGLRLQQQLRLRQA